MKQFIGDQVYPADQFDRSETVGIQPHLLRQFAEFRSAALLFAPVRAAPFAPQAKPRGNLRKGIHLSAHPSFIGRQRRFSLVATALGRPNR